MRQLYGGQRGTMVLIVAIAILATSCCGLFDYDHAEISDRLRAVAFVRDTPEVQHLVREAEHFNQEAVWNGGLPEQHAFIDAMARQPRIEIPPASYLRVLEQSQAICTDQRHQNPHFIKVRVTTGSAKGQIGWGCEGVDVTRTDDMP